MTKVTVHAIACCASLEYHIGTLQWQLVILLHELNYGLKHSSHSRPLLAMGADYELELQMMLLDSATEGASMVQLLSHGLHPVSDLSCRSVTAMRKWYHGSRGQGGPFKPSNTPQPLMKREEILDRYSQHVKHCPSCSKVCQLLLNTQLITWSAVTALRSIESDTVNKHFVCYRSTAGLYFVGRRDIGVSVTHCCWAAQSK